MKEYTGQRKLTLNVDDLHIPFMAWSSGQKEFMPLLLAFYYLEDHLSDGIKKDKYKYVVIEEPEMGLHPKAIISIILQIINLMQTYGYKIIISTHSSVFLEFAWAFNLLKSAKSYQGIYKIFDIEDSTIIKNMLCNIYDKTIKTYYFSRSENDKVVSHDISSLDVASEDVMISEWGGISEFSSKMSDIVSQYGIDNEKIKQEFDYDTIAPSMF